MYDLVLFDLVLFETPEPFKLKPLMHLDIFAMRISNTSAISYMQRYDWHLTAGKFNVFCLT